MRRVPRRVRFIGSIWKKNVDSMAELARACIERDLVLEQYGAFVQDGFPRFDDRHVRITRRAVSIEDNQRLVREALLAPALCGATDRVNNRQKGTLARKLEQHFDGDLRGARSSTGCGPC